MTVGGIVEGLGQIPEQPLLSTQRPSLWSLGATHCLPPPAPAPPGQGHSYALSFGLRAR